MNTDSLPTLHCDSTNDFASCPPDSVRSAAFTSASLILISSPESDTNFTVSPSTTWAMVPVVQICSSQLIDVFGGYI